MNDLSAVIDLLDEEVGPGSWELVIKTRGTAAASPVRVEAAAVARPASNGVPAHRTDWRKKPVRKAAAAAAPGRYEEKLCGICHKNRHPAKYDSCWDCKLWMDGLDPEQIVPCSECQEGEHKRRFPRCYDCSKARR